VTEECLWQQELPTMCFFTAFPTRPRPDLQDPASFPRSRQLQIQLLLSPLFQFWSLLAAAWFWLSLAPTVLPSTISPPSYISSGSLRKQKYWARCWRVGKNFLCRHPCRDLLSSRQERPQQILEIQPQSPQYQPTAWITKPIFLPLT